MGRKRIERTEEHNRQIQTLAGIGLTLDQIAMVLDISPGLLDNWLKDREINMLYKKGKALAQGQVGKTLYQKAVAGDTAAIIWYEKSRCGFSGEKPDKELDTSQQLAPQVTIVLPDNSRGDRGE